MNISKLDDDQNALPSLACFGKLAGHAVTIWNDHVEDPDVLAARLAQTEVRILIRERSFTDDSSTAEPTSTATSTAMSTATSTATPGQRRPAASEVTCTT